MESSVRPEKRLWLAMQARDGCGKEKYDGSKDTKS